MSEIEYIDVFEQYRMLVFLFCKKRTGDHMEAEDICTDTFIELWKNIETVNVGSAKAFLMVTANRKLIDHFKMSARRQARETSFSVLDFEGVEIDADVLGYVYSVIQCLHPRQREIIKMRFLKDMTRQEIADELGITKRTVSNTIQNGITQIREHVKKSKFLV